MVEGVLLPVEQLQSSTKNSLCPFSVELRSMKISLGLVCLLGSVQAFAPASSWVGRSPASWAMTSPINTRHSVLAMDPHHFAETGVTTLTQLQDFVSSLPTLSLADAADMATSMPGDVVEEAAGSNNGWFGFLTGPIAGLLQVIHSAMVAVGLKANAWGASIIFLTLLIKAVTFPLTKQQLESTSKMQALSPAIKEIQAKYQSNPEVMNQKVAEFYQVNEINPLAGCLPSLAQIPIFIGLYRAVLELASENKLDEPFLFLPNLEGPTYGADPAHGSDWLLQGWVDGVPSLGWDDTISFLILPVFLVVSQFVSMELMQPKTDDPAQQQSNIILKVLPIMIGWFALNVPAALSVYWVINNIVTTGTSLFIRSTLKVEPVKAGGATAGAATMEPPPTIFAPPREKPSGFGTPAPAPISSDSVTPLTVIDAETLDDDDGDDDGSGGVDTAFKSSSSAPKKKRGKKGKKKKRT